MFFGSEAPEVKQKINFKYLMALHYMHRCVLSFVCRWVSIPVALAYTTLACGSLFCRSSTALPIFVDEAFLALWHSSKIICDRERSRPTVLTPKMYQIPVRHELFSFLFKQKKGYNSIKIGLAPVLDLFDSGPVLPSSLALTNQRRVRSKQDSF